MIFCLHFTFLRSICAKDIELCSLKAVADAVAHAAPPPEGLDGPGALLELRVARGYMDTLAHLAPLDVGALVLQPQGFQLCGLDELVGLSFACEIVQRLSAKLLPKAAQVEVQQGSGLSQGYVDPRVGKCRRDVGNFCVLSSMV